MSAPRVLIGGLFHETHTFLDGTTPLREFAILRDAELLQRTGDSSPLGGVLESARTYGWEVIPTIDYAAVPSAIVEDEVVEAFWRDLESRITQPLDAVYLVLHGAMTSQSFTDVEGELLGRLRAVIGNEIPIFGVFDLHANFTQAMAERANCLVAYRENPHIDGRRAAMISAELLERCLKTGLKPRMYWEHPPVIWPPTGTGTASEPMRSLEAKARELEVKHSDFWAVSVVAGFSFADTPDTGVSFTVATSGEETEARAALGELSAMAFAARDAGNVTDPPIDEVMATLKPLPPGLTVLVEPADNIGAGAPGDGTGILRALIRHEIPNALVAINDPEAVQQLAGKEPGARVTLSIGGHGSRLDAGPVTLEVTLVRLGDGKFELEDKQSHLASMSGNFFDMGPCAVVRAGEVTILLSSNKTPPFDLAQYRSQGIEPTEFSVVGVKAAVAHRRVYDPIAARMLWVDTPGPCTSTIRALPFQKVRRPVFPLDEVTGSAPLA